LPFSHEEIHAILGACDRIYNRNPKGVDRARLRARALVLLLLYSGLRISDAAKLSRSRVDMKTGQMLIRMMKTRHPLYLPLNEETVNALAAIPVESPYFFWSGKGNSVVRSARRTIMTVLRLADVADGHPHRFRDTFSVELLNNGAELRTVQLLLGHKSIKTTEKHYAPFVTSMQRQLDQAVATLNFGHSSPPAPLGVDPEHNAVRNAKRNVLAFSRANRS
jgi:integrase